MTSAHLSATDHARLLRRGFALEYATLGWNVAGIAVLAYAAIAARSVALAGFALDSRTGSAGAHPHHAAELHPVVPAVRPPHRSSATFQAVPGDPRWRVHAENREH
jgi:hypothetical protein